MRAGIRQFVIIANETLPLRAPIYEFGAFQVPGQETLANLRPLFPGQEYIGADIEEGPGVDVILDLHDIDLPDGVAATVLSLDTLEHVEYPHTALEEIHRILDPKGIVLISSVMKFHIHYQPDYWRFTPEGFKSLLKPFAHWWVGYAGSIGFPHTVIGLGFKGTCPPRDEFEKRYETWQQEAPPG